MAEARHLSAVAHICAALVNLNLHGELAGEMANILPCGKFPSCPAATESR